MSERPPHGVCLPVHYVSSRDGDTILVSLGSDGGLVWPIRLDGINCPEKRHPGGFEAHDFVIKLLTDADLSVWVDAPKRKNILRSLSFDRIIGDLFIEDKGWLTDLLVEAGHAKRV
jgi:endonuclease YncB( thermonuclease family)